MIDAARPCTLRVACPQGLTPYLEREIEALGYTVDASQPTGVELTGSLLDAMRLNLYLRTGMNVLYLLAAFPCADPDELYEQANALAWEEMISPEEYLSIVANVSTPTITDWRFAALRVKDAIVDRMAWAVGRRPDSGPERENFVLHLHWHGDRCQLYINTSGRKLSDRNYRKIPHKAPMQETLAAAVVLATGYDGTQPLLNPMCGSGTLAIEAALIASGRPPGLLRSNFGFMHLKDYPAQAWQDMRRAAKKVRSRQAVAPIIASDADEKATSAARKNAETAGVHHLIEFVTADFADTPIPDRPGILLLNPEYGERLGAIAELEKTYARIGDFFKQRCAEWTGYIFTGNPGLAKKVGLRASRRIEFFNAKIECRLLKYELYAGTRRRFTPADQD